MICLASLLVCTCIVITIIIVKGRKYTVVGIAVSIACFLVVNTVTFAVQKSDICILLHSDGENGCAVIISDDISVLVITGNDIEELTTAMNTLRLYNKVRPQMILLCPDTQDSDITNITTEAKGLADIVIPSGKESSLSGEHFSLVCKDDIITLTAGDTTINISDISDIRSDCLNIAWGYDKDITTEAPCLFFDKKQRSGNGIPLYYTKIELKISYNGIVMKNEYK